MNTDRHIASAFDRDLEGVQALVLRMGGLVESALAAAADALELGDASLARKVMGEDAVIDLLEEQVNSECARLIAIRAPTASDLRTVLAVMKIASSQERCGDYAKNLAKRSVVLTQMRPIPGAAGSVRRMARLVGLLLQEALDAFIARDVLAAISVRERDIEVDQMYSSLFREFLTYMLEDPANITACMHLHFIAKNIERVGDHATTIAEQVIYLSTGALPGLERVKGEGVIQPGGPG